MILYGVKCRGKAFPTSLSFNALPRKAWGVNHSHIWLADAILYVLPPYSRKRVNHFIYRFSFSYRGFRGVNNKQGEGEGNAEG